MDWYRLRSTYTHNKNAITSRAQYHSNIVLLAKIAQFQLLGRCKTVSSTNAKTEIERTIGVLEARADCAFRGEITEEDYYMLCKTIGHLKKWLQSDEIKYVPDEAGQQIWFKQYARSQV
jgi:hypothetical protein